MYKYNDISVIIPTYNNGKWIKSCLDSVINQTVDVAEVIVIDDGSTDDTYQIMQEYLKKFAYIHYIYQNNSGVSAARNKGIRSATGKLIAFIDSDDIWLPEKTKKQVDLLNQFKNKDASFDFTDTFAINYKNGSFYHVRSCSKEGNYQQELLYNNIVNSTSSVICNKQVLLDAGGFDETLAYGEDKKLWVKISSVCSMVTFSEVLTIRRFHDNNVSHNFNKNELVTEKLYLSLVPEFIKNKTELNKMLLSNLSGFLVLYAKSGDVLNIRRLFWKLYKISPRILFASKGKFFFIFLFSLFGKDLMVKTFALYDKFLQRKPVHKYAYLSKYID